MENSITELSAFNFEKHTRPNTIYVHDVVGEQSGRNVAYRFIIEITREKTFFVRELRYNLPYAPYPVVGVKHNTSEKLLDAQRKVDELLDEKICQGFASAHEESRKVVCLFNKPLRRVKPTFITMRDAGRIDTSTQTMQRLPEGLHVFMKVNEFGDVALQSANDVSNGFNGNAIELEHVREFGKRLTELPRFKSVLIEGFATKEGEEDSLKGSIKLTLDLLYKKFGTGFFVVALFCVVFGGLTSGTIVRLIKLQNYQGLTSFLIALAAMAILVIFAVLFFNRYKLDLKEASLKSVIGSFSVALILYCYGVYQDIDTKKNMLELSKKIIELSKENKSLNDKLEALQGK